MPSGYKVAVVGVTGAAGSEMVKILEERDFPVKRLVPLVSKSSIGESIEFKGDSIPLQVINEHSFKGIDIGFFFAGEAMSKEFVPIAVRNGCVAIDSTSAFRLKKGVPLVVPEVNPHRIKGHKGIIANPTCSTIQLVVVLNPIHKQTRIKRIVVSTYQAVSGTGKNAMDELTEQVRDLFNFREPEIKVYPHQIAFNAIPHIDEFVENAYTAEEMKIVHETRKILEDDSIRICATTVRVPVFYGHSEAVNIETEKKLNPDAVREILVNAPGVIVEDDPRHNKYPLAIYAAARDECFVGRIRKDISADNGIVMWIVSDNIRKGAALNAVQIAELL
ncbi:MAG: aspartate-semialdehyde dehydrogenase [Thermodesulfobacteriota bacterium]|nr:aspartate-semialdehyde dehydrogenase [Thermodesulfobacteriota bacterium]